MSSLKPAVWKILKCIVQRNKLLNTLNMNKYFPHLINFKLENMFRQEHSFCNVSNILLQFIK